MEIRFDLQPAAQSYIDLLRDTLLGLVHEDPPSRAWGPNRDTLEFHLQTRAEGRDWPSSALSMIGIDRMNNIADLVAEIVREDIPGDLIETGVWRGGAVIFMRGLLRVLGDHQRRVYVADSFEGLPKPDPMGFPADEGLDFSEFEELAVDVDTVRANFERFGMLDDQVVFLEGWFKDTLPKADIESLSLVRLDGDLYESTFTALESLYPKLSGGGFLIVDDYGDIPPCRLAVHDYRAEQGIDDPIQKIDHTGVYWRKST